VSAPQEIYSPFAAYMIRTMQLIEDHGKERAGIIDCARRTTGMVNAAEHLKRVERTVVGRRAANVRLAR
jgi:hypothetical protein